jgi:ribosomal protein S18 acetylase RimI-like enzyme
VILHPIDPASDVRALHAADSVAFADNADAFEESFENFEAEHLAVDSLDTTASAVARRGETIAGFTVCQRRPGDIGYIDLLAVLPDERRHGLGAALLAHALGAFAQAGLRAARLETASDNPTAIRLYERAGMQRGPGADVWEKPLS